MKINEYLKIRRKEMNLTLLDVAKVCGVSEATVVGFCYSSQEPSDAVIPLFIAVRCRQMPSHSAT